MEITILGSMNKRSFINFIRQADLVIVGAGRPIGWQGGYLTPYEVGELAQKGKIKHLVLSRLKDIDKEKELISDCRKTYQDKIAVVRDLIKFKL